MDSVINPSRMRIFFIDNEHTDYIVLASDLDEAWRKLRERHGILPLGSEPPRGNSDLCEAYHGMYEVGDGYGMDNPHDLVFVV